MKTILVMSDSHGRRSRLNRILPLFAENDHIVHLGDGAADMHEALSLYPEKVIVCRGNCDPSFGMDEYILEAEGMRIFCCHGHRYGVKSGLAALAARAKDLSCSIALYGHTHCARIEEQDGVLLINPGAIGAWSDASYCYLVVHAGKATPTLVPLT